MTFGLLLILASGFGVASGLFMHNGAGDWFQERPIYSQSSESIPRAHFPPEPNFLLRVELVTGVVVVSETHIRLVFCKGLAEYEGAQFAVWVPDGMTELLTTDSVLNIEHPAVVTIPGWDVIELRVQWGMSVKIVTTIQSINPGASKV